MRIVASEYTLYTCVDGHHAVRHFYLDTCFPKASREDITVSAHAYFHFGCFQWEAHHRAGHHFAGSPFTAP